ncbi:MAG: hypothetical protein HC827_20155 [Cyanobacteria bacterium RM1_2_2]|nr:hypothetical protein [Cyanobacteria bacterium RM1_2_2]
MERIWENSDEAFKGTVKALRQGTMKRLLNFVILAGVVTGSQVSLALAQAAEAWVEVAVSSAGDRVLVDQNSIQRTEEDVRYWEYRDLRQSRNAAREMVGNQPVYGMMIYRSVDCDARVGRMQRLVIFNQNREVIRRVNYEETNAVDLPIQGSNAEAVLKFVCEPT